MPFSPGMLLDPLSMPTLERPESEATGASPGALAAEAPGASGAVPVPCAGGKCVLASTGDRVWVWGEGEEKEKRREEKR